MYFPYFRGRQYELLALKELISKSLISSSVVPVIEPVKHLPALKKALLAFQTNAQSVGLILNPNVGDLTDEPKIISQLMENYVSTPNIIPSLLLNESAMKVMKELEDRGIAREKTLIVFNNLDYLPIYQTLFDNEPKYTLCPDDRHIHRLARQNSVLFENKFHKRSRNADYPEEEFFSKDHLDYTLDHYIGFGDYSIIGDEYIESGFAPYAVVIHIVYFADDNSLRIKHFVSDSNDDISNVAGKFYEAVEKLYRWYNGENQRHQLTNGLQTLLNHYEHKSYPGLPTIKKLSIMHHLELMSRYLDGKLEK